MADEAAHKRLLEPKNEGLSQKLEQTHGYAERPVPRVSRYLEATLFTQQYNGQAVKSTQAFAHAERARDDDLFKCMKWQSPVDPPKNQIIAIISSPNATHRVL